MTRGPIEEGSDSVFDQETDRLQLTGMAPQSVAPPEFQASLSDNAFAKWAVASGVPPHVVDGARAARRMGLHQSLVERKVLELDAVLQMMRPPASAICARCRLHYTLGEPLLAKTISVLRCPGCGGSLQRLDQRGEAPLEQSQDVSRAPEATEPYRLEQLLGRGGMGNVYLATTAEGAKVAIKLLHEELLQESDLQARFEREGEILSQLQHPNLVGTLGRGFDPTSGRPFLMLEYVPGRDLETVLSERPEGRLSPQEGAFVLDRCARALAAAHAQGIIHRDVKPSNVLITPHGDVKLTDFGIALVKDVSVRLTRQDEVMGTPQYVAPEILLGAEWTPPADVYSLGSFAFRIFSGQQLFPASSVKETLQAHIDIPARDLGGVVDVPPALSTLVQRLLSKDPADRPTAEEVSDGLRATGLVEETRAMARLWSEEGRAPGEDVPAPDRSETTQRALLPKRAGSIKPGKGFGPYDVLEQIGKGRTGTVYLVQHRETAARYALKVLHPSGMEDKSQLARFELETKTLEKLKAQAGVVGIHGAGRTAGGRPYFLMDYVPGIALDKALRDGLSRSRGLDALERVAGALANAHEQGLVHRDIKPENILLDSEGRAWLTDFGVARVVGSDTRLTQTGEVVGTLAYMAPEQADKELGEVGPPTDVYSLGGILYELLCGVPPHQGKNAIAVYSRLLRGEPLPRPSELDPKVPKQLEEVCQRAMARMPSSRFPDAGEFRRFLRLAREVVRIEDVRAERTIDQRLKKVIIGLVVGLVVTVGLVALAVSQRVKEERHEAGQSLALKKRIDATRAALAAGQYAQVIEEGPGLVDELSAADAEAVRVMVRAAHRERITASYRAGDLSEARARLPASAVWGDATPEVVAWVHALSGEYKSALLALPPRAAEARARVAAWAGDAGGLRDALDGVPGARGDALAWELSPYLTQPPRARSTTDAPAAGAAHVVAGERALAQGFVALAAIEFDEARGAKDPLVKLSALLGLARVELARGRFPAAVAPLTRAWALAERPQDRARALGLAAQLALGLPSRPLRNLEQALGGRILEKASNEAPGHPWVRSALRARSVRAAWSGGGAFPDPEQPPSAVVDKARSVARRGKTSAALAALKRGSRAPAQASFVEAERRACARGRDGAPGLLLARAAELALAAERGNSRASARRALDLLELAGRLRPSSPLRWAGAARAALVLHDAQRARKAIERSLVLSPNDGRVLFLRARVEAAALAAERLRADLSRCAGKSTPEQEEAVAKKLLEVADAFDEARRVSKGSLRTAALLAAAAARLEAEQRDGKARGALKPIQPLLEGIAREKLLAARRDLVGALAEASPDPSQISQAETALGKAAQKVGPAALSALLLEASGGSAKAARAYLALTGELPARAIFAMRRGAMHSSPRVQAQLFAKAVSLYPRLPMARLLKEAASANLGRTSTSMLRLARVVRDAPELFGLAIGVLYFADDSVRSLLKSRLRDLDPARVKGRLGMAYLARALAFRSVRVGWPAEDVRGTEEGKAEVARLTVVHRQRSVQSYRDAARAVQLHPALVAGHMVRALSISALGTGAGPGARWDARVAVDLHHTLECARAAAPTASPVLVYHLHYHAPRELPWLVDAALAQGFVRNYRSLLTNRRHRKRIVAWMGPAQGVLEGLDESDPRELRDAARKLAEGARFPRLALSLALTAWRDPRRPLSLDVSRYAELLTKLGDDEEARRAQCKALLTQAAAGRSKAPDQVSAISIAARRALEAAAPAGTWLGSGPPRVMARGVRAVSVSHIKRFNRLQQSFFPSQGRMAALVERLGSPELALFGIARANRRLAKRGRPWFLESDDLRQRWGPSQAVLRTVQEGGLQEEAIGWLLAGKHVGEVRLAIDRAAAFSRGEPSAEVVTRLVLWWVRRRALKEEGEGGRKLLEVALGAIRQAQGMTRTPHGLWALAAHLQLDLAGRMKVGERRTRWLKRGLEDAQAVKPGRVPVDLRVVATWGVVRGHAALGDAKGVAEAVPALERALNSKRARKVLKRFTENDPLLPELRRDERVRKLLEQAG